jgi:hypothetical protein
MTPATCVPNGVRSLDVSCWQCHHRAIMSAAPWPDDVPVPTFGARHGVHAARHIGADARPKAGTATAREPDGGAMADMTDKQPAPPRESFKRGLIGVYQHVDSKHLDRYLAQFDFRQNTRAKLGVNDVERAAIAVKGAARANGSQLITRNPNRSAHG